MDYSQEEQQAITKSMVDKIHNESYQTTEDELIQDKDWITASKDVYKELNGKEWSGADEDLAKEGLSMMSQFNYNLTLGTINYTAKMQDADDKTKLSFYYMMDTYDKKDISGRGVARAFKEIGLDPSSYIGIATLGAGFVGKQAVGQTAKAGLKEMFKQGAMNYLKNTTATVATEAGIYTATDDLARQSAKVGANMQDNIDLTETAIAGGTGAVLGGTVAKAVPMAVSGVKKVVEKVTND